MLTFKNQTIMKKNEEKFLIIKKKTKNKNRNYAFQNTEADCSVLHIVVTTLAIGFIVVVVFGVLI